MSALPYPDTDCVQEFMRELQTAPRWSCEHLAASPGQSGVRQMCRPDTVTCWLCGFFDLSAACFDCCHCCGREGAPLTVVQFAVTRDRISCSAVLCELCLSLVPPGVGRVLPVAGGAR